MVIKLSIVMVSMSILYGCNSSYTKSSGKDFNYSPKKHKVDTSYSMMAKNRILELNLGTIIDDKKYKPKNRYEQEAVNILNQSCDNYSCNDEKIARAEKHLESFYANNSLRSKKIVKHPLANNPRALSTRSSNPRALSTRSSNPRALSTRSSNPRALSTRSSNPRALSTRSSNPRALSTEKNNSTFIRAKNCLQLIRTTNRYATFKASFRNICPYRVHVRYSLSTNGSRQNKYPKGTYSLRSTGLTSISPGVSAAITSASKFSDIPNIVYAACRYKNAATYTPYFTGPFGEGYMCK